MEKAVAATVPITVPVTGANPRAPGPPKIGETENWKQVSELKVLNALKMEAVWDAHFEASCRFNDINGEF